MTLPRFYPILDTALLARRGLAVEEAARAIIDGGAGILQFRHKGTFSRELFEQAERVAKMGALFIVDDRADIARLLDAGVHVGQDDLPPSEARTIVGPGRMVGFSTHNEAQLLAGAREPVDYLAIGPIFATASKEQPDPVVGLEELQRLRALWSGPLVAIGGITRANARAVLEAGADSVAVIGDLCMADDLRRRTEEWQQIVR